MVQTEFTSAEREMICQSLGDSPFTAITVYQIRQDTVNMVLAGTPSEISALVVQSHNLLEEPNAFGDDVDAIIDGLQKIYSWTCVNVSQNIADELAERMGKSLQRSIRHYGDVHYLLEQPIDMQNSVIKDVDMRILTTDDMTRLDNPPTALLESELGDYVAGAIVDNQMVAIAHAHALSDRYADVGVHTDEAWRNQGISTYLAYLVMHRLQSRGYIPIWSTGEDNVASQRVAEKLGMQFYGSRVYLILEETI